MSYIPLLLIGTSDSGFDGVSYQPKNIEDAKEVYGWYRNEHFTLTPSSTSITLDFPVWGNEFRIWKRIGTSLIPDPLYNPTLATASYITFGQPGASGDYLVKYVRNPEETNILTALQIVLQQNSPIPHLYRVAGNTASLTIGDLILTAKESGVKYNGITIQVTGNVFTIYYEDSLQYPVVSYNIASTFDLVNKINTGFSRNIHPLQATYYTSSVSGVPDGNYTLTGGSSGILDESTISNILNTLDINNIGMILLCGGQSSGVVTQVINWFDNYGEIPTCVIIGSPISYQSWSSQTYLDYLNNLDFNNKKIFYVAGWGKTTIVYGTSYLSSLSSCFAGLWNSYSSSPTHKSTSLEQITPYWTEAQLSLLGQKYCVFNKFIQTNFGPFRSSPTNGENPLLNKVKLDIAKRMSNSFDDIIGNPEIDIDVIKSKTQEALDGIENVKELEYSCSLDLYQITINISLVVFGETQAIQLTISSIRNINE